MMRLFKIPLFLVAGLSLAFASIARGGGIEVPMQDAKAAGEADAFTAQADDPSAIFYNPSGLTQIQGTQISAGAYYLQPTFHFRGDDGSNERMDLPSVLPHVYAASDLGTENLRIGLGIDNVFGINEDYGNTGPLRLLVDKAQLSVINISPTIAYKLTNNLSIGVAGNIYYGNLYLQHNVLLGAPPFPEGQFHERGSGFAYGATPSLMYKINDNNQIGAYYRSPFTLDMKGPAQVGLNGTALVGPSTTQNRIDLPESIGIGYAFKPITPLTLEADVIWTDWHSVKELTVESDNPAFNGQNLPADWKSGFTFRGGIQYAITQNWSIRGGYAYSQNSVPGSTFSPLVPDSNYHLGALGLGYSSDHWAVDIAYDFIYRDTRHIANSVDSPAVDGTWHNIMNGLMLTGTLKL